MMGEVVEYFSEGVGFPSSWISNFPFQTFVSYFTIEKGTE